VEGQGRAKLHVLPYLENWRVGDIRPTDLDDWNSCPSAELSR